MKIIVLVLKKVVVALCILYSINLIISQMNVVLPINFLTIGLVSVLGMPSVFGILILKRFM